MTRRGLFRRTLAAIGIGAVVPAATAVLHGREGIIEVGPPVESGQHRHDVRVPPACHPRAIEVYLPFRASRVIEVTVGGERPAVWTFDNKPSVVGVHMDRDLRPGEVISVLYAYSFPTLRVVSG